MKAVVVLLALVAVALLRVGLRRRGGRRRRASSPEAAPSRPPGRFGPRATLGMRGLGGTVGLVAGREVRERLRGRVFKAVTVVLFGVVAAAVVVPALSRAPTSPTRVGVVAGSPAVESALRGLAASLRTPVQLVGEPDPSRARAALRAGRLQVVVDGTSEIVVEDPLSAADTSAQARFVRAASTALGEGRAFARAGLTAAQVAVLSRAEPLPVVSIHPGKKPRTTAQSTALLGVILVFIVLTQYLSWTLMGVVEEKANRVVEVLLATVRPVQLLAGKVLGIGVVALAQAVALVAFALVLAEAVGSSLIHGAAPLVAAATLAWLVLGYAFYSWMYAAAGSLAERPDQVQSLALPLGAPLVLGYVVSLVGAGSGRPSALLQVLAYLPPTAPFAMPTLVGAGDAAWWQFLLSVLATLAGTVVVALVAAAVYRRAVLRSGGRVRLRQLLPGRAG